MSAPGVFKKHTARVYVANKALKSYTYAAMNNWNKALKVKAFKVGTKAHHTMTVGFKNAGTGDGSWDGYYITSKLYINYNFFDNANYLPAVYKAITGKSLPSGDQPNSAAYKSVYDTYWKSVITHELGHSLSLTTPLIPTILWKPTPVPRAVTPSIRGIQQKLSMTATQSSQTNYHLETLTGLSSPGSWDTGKIK